MSNRIIIDLNGSQASVKKDFIYKNEVDKVLKLIIERVGDIEKANNQFGSNKIKEYEETRMHDAILIDGKRGSGKTTFLLNIIDHIQSTKENRLSNSNPLQKIKVLYQIDPNQLDNKSNILLIIIANVYTALLEAMQDGNQDTKKHHQFKELSTMIHNLVSAISASQERNYEDDYHKLYNLHKSLVIDETLHEFFSKVCDFFNVTILVLLVDDIDMDFMHGYKVIDTIRKYLSTPRIVPLVSVDTAQIYALVKKKHFAYFGYKANTTKDEILPENELDFLKNLPEEYLQKILMPTRRIVLPDIYELYETHIDKSRPIALKFSIDKSNENNLEFEMEMELALKAYINIVYGYRIHDTENIDNPHLLNYLKGKIFRSFSEDMIAFFNGLKSTQSQEKTEYSYRTQSIKERLAPMHIDHFDTKYDATIWFWDRYLAILKKRMEHYIKEHGTQNRTHQTSNFYINILTYILYIDSFVEKKFIAGEQTYARLYMQDFFIEKIAIVPLHDTRHPLKILDFQEIRKTINILGIVELLARTMLPAHIFENLVNERIVNIFKYNLEELKYFSRDNTTTLREAMFDLSTSILKYNDENHQKESSPNKSQAKLEHHESNKNIIGIFLSEKHKKIFGEYALLIEKYIDFKQDRTIYFLSPLKFYAMLPQYFKAIHNNQLQKLEALIKTLSIEYHYNPQNIYGFAYPLLESSDIKLDIINSNLGVISMDEFAKNLAKNILQISTQEYSNNFLDEMSNKSESHYRLFLNKHVATYKCIYLNHLILFLVKQIDQDFFYEHLRELRSAYITHGVREKDLKRYKIPENFFAINIKIILKAIKTDDNDSPKLKNMKSKYSQIEPFLYKLYLTMLKNIQYQSSFYIVKDKDFDIKKEYIERYINELKIEPKPKLDGNTFDVSKLEPLHHHQFQELKNLYENLDKLYEEGEALDKLYEEGEALDKLKNNSDEVKECVHKKLLEEYETLYDASLEQNSKKIIYRVAAKNEILEKINECISKNGPSTN